MVDWITLTLVCLMSALAYWYYTLPSNAPPGPVSIPYIGSWCLFTVPESRRLAEYMTKWSNTYGPIYSLYAGPKMMVVLNGYKAIKEALVIQGRIFSDRPGSCFGSYAGSINFGLILANGELWMKSRKFVLTVLRNFGLGTNKLEDLIKEEINFLIGHISNLEVRPFNPKSILEYSIMNMVCQLTFGLRLEYDHPKIRKLVHLLNSTIKNVDNGFTVILIQLLRYVPNTRWQRQYRIQIELMEFIRDAIGDHKRTRDPNYNRDLIDTYLSDQETRPEVKDVFTDYNLLLVTRDIFIAGTETTSSVLTWSLLFMASNPEIQGRVQQEIDSVVGRDRLPIYADMEHMPYTESAILETLRRGNLVPLSVVHWNTEPTEIFGHHIPKNSLIIPNLHSIMFDPELWPDPYRYDPGRFYDNGKVRKFDEFIPFSVGPRVCLGEKLAWLEMFLFFSSLLHQFTFEVDGSNPPSLEHVGCAVSTPKEFVISARKR